MLAHTLINAVKQMSTGTFLSKFIEIKIVRLGEGVRAQLNKFCKINEYMHGL